VAEIGQQSIRHVDARVRDAAQGEPHRDPRPWTIQVSEQYFCVRRTLSRVLQQAQCSSRIAQRAGHEHRIASARAGARQCLAGGNGAERGDRDGQWTLRGVAADQCDIVRTRKFGKALRGYDPERVNQFRDQVAEELERLSRINQELEARARGFHEQLKAFRDRDKAINDALVTAQQLRGDIREQADKEAQLILREARAEAERIMEGARSESRRIEDQLASLERSRRAYLSQLRMMIERQLSEVVAAEQLPGSDSTLRDSASDTAWVASLLKE